jgi:hypothetical protein
LVTVYNATIHAHFNTVQGIHQHATHITERAAQPTNSEAATKRWDKTQSKINKSKYDH